jgi:hypothetical protein
LPGCGAALPVQGPSGFPGCRKDIHTGYLNQKRISFGILDIYKAQSRYPGWITGCFSGYLESRIEIHVGYLKRISSELIRRTYPPNLSVTSGFIG